MTVKVEWVAGRLPAAVSPAAAVGDTARGLADATARVEQQLLRLARASQAGQESLAALQSSLAAGGQAAATAERQLADYGLGLARQAAQVQQSQRGQRQLAQSQAALSESQAKGARQLAASRQAWQRYQAQLDQLRLEPLRNGLADLQTTLTDNFQAALRGNLKDWTDWADAGRNILTRFLADIASQQVILPAMAGLGGALGLSAQQMGLPAAPGQQAGSLSAMDALGLANQGASAFGVDGLPAGWAVFWPPFPMWAWRGRRRRSSRRCCSAATRTTPSARSAFAAGPFRTARWTAWTAPTPANW